MLVLCLGNGEDGVGGAESSSDDNSSDFDEPVARPRGGSVTDSPLFESLSETP